MIRVFDAFSGIGGFRTALERVGGFEIVGWCELDKFAQKAYRAMFDTGGEQFYENIRNIDTDGLADFDLLVGGFPCQPFSVAGKRLGAADERGDLFFELARILKAKRPAQPQLSFVLLSLKMFPDCWVLRKAKLMQKSRANILILA